VYAASHEGALHVEDVLTRRTRISIETFDRGLGALRPTAEILAGVLGWTGEQVDREVAHYRLRVEAERASQEQPDDETADADDRVGDRRGHRLRAVPDVPYPRGKGTPGPAVVSRRADCLHRSRSPTLVRLEIGYSHSLIAVMWMVAS
jgi:hypothetical protein